MSMRTGSVHLFSRHHGYRFPSHAKSRYHHEITRDLAQLACTRHQRLSGQQEIGLDLIETLVGLPRRESLTILRQFTVD